MQANFGKEARAFRHRTYPIISLAAFAKASCASVTSLGSARTLDAEPSALYPHRWRSRGYSLDRGTSLAALVSKFAHRKQRSKT